VDDSEVVTAGVADEDEAADGAGVAADDSEVVAVVDVLDIAAGVGVVGIWVAGVGVGVGADAAGGAAAFLTLVIMHTIKS